MFRTPTALLLTVGFTAIVLVNNAYVVWGADFCGREVRPLGHARRRLLDALSPSGGSGGGADRRPPLGCPRPPAPPVPPGTANRGDAGGRTGDPLDGARREPDGDLDRDGGGGALPRVYESNTHASLFDVIPPCCRASAVGVMVMIAFLIGSASPWLLGQCRELLPHGQGLSCGFAALSIAYLLGGLAVLAAVKFTFLHDYWEEAPQP